MMRVMSHILKYSLSQTVRINKIRISERYHYHTASYIFFKFSTKPNQTVPPSNEYPLYCTTFHSNFYDLFNDREIVQKMKPEITSKSKTNTT